MSDVRNAERGMWKDRRRVRDVTALCLVLLGMAAEPASGRERVLVLPFLSADRWAGPAPIGLATALSLGERLGRTPSVKVVPLMPFLIDLLKSGMALEEVTSAGVASAQRLGTWVGASTVITGMVGDGNSLVSLAGFSGPDERPPSDTEIWLGVVAVDVATGTPNGTGLAWGRRTELMDLHYRALRQLAEAVGLARRDLARDAVLRHPTRSFAAYGHVARAISRYLELQVVAAPDAARAVDAEGLSLLRDALQTDRKYAQAHAWLGEYHLLSGNREAAASEYRTAIDLDPDLLAPRYGLARLAATDRSPVALEEALGGIVRVAPWDDEAWVWMGRSCLRRGAVTLARAAFVRAAGLGTRLPEVYFELSLMARREGRRSEALAYLERAAELVPTVNAYRGIATDAIEESGRPGDPSPRSLQ